MVPLDLERENKLEKLSKQIKVKGKGKVQVSTNLKVKGRKVERDDRKQI